MADTVAVIGGGPAGCSAAIHLARRGVGVTLLEARAYPHDKLCGEFLSPECTEILQELGLAPALRALGPAAIERVHLTAPGAEWHGDLPGPALGLTRRALDYALSQRAAALGVEVRAGVSVTGIDGDLREGFQLRTSDGNLPARAVIAAHGRRGGLDRALGRRFLRQPQPFVALKAHFAGPPLPGRIALHGFPGGYCGMSEVERGSAVGGRAANVCLLVREPVFRRVTGDGPERIANFIQWLRAQNTHLDDWLSRAERLDERWLSVAQVPFGPKPAVEREVLMAGDAAGLITPLAGDGIAMALRGGQLAAEHLLAFLSGAATAPEMCHSYAAAWQRQFSARVHLGRWLQIVMLRPRLLALGLRLLAAAPPLGRYVVAHTRETQPPAASPR
jgi:flavin-dependent dehydrogenase